MDVRRISRWGLNVLAGLSLVLCLATATLWVRSYWYYDQVRRTTERDDLSLNSYLGEVQLLAGLDVWPGAHNRRFCHNAWPTGWADVWPPKETQAAKAQRHWLGFGFNKVDRGGVNPKGGWRRGRHLYLPHWFLVITFAALPALRLALAARNAKRRAWRRARNLCLVCGYDLRASPAACPECGTPNGAAHPARAPHVADEINGAA